MLQQNCSIVPQYEIHQSCEVFNSQDSKQTITLTEELQELLVSVFHLENKIKVLNKNGSAKKEALSQMNSLREQLQKIEKQLYNQPKHKKSRSCYSSNFQAQRNLKQIQTIQSQADRICLTSRVKIQKRCIIDQTLLNDKNPQIPSVSIQLKYECPEITVSNQQEILESFDKQADDNQNIKKSQWNNYTVSFDSHPLQQKNFGSYSKIELQHQQSHFNTSLFNTTNSEFLKKSEISPLGQIETQGLLVYIIKNQNQVQSLYDPIKDYQKNPIDFGYEVQRLKHDPLEGTLNFYRQSQHLDTKENLGSFFYPIKKIHKVESFNIGSQSEKAVIFKKIYNRINCNESIALQHLKMKCFPFYINYENQIIEGLASSQEDLQIMKEFFLKFK